MAANATRWGILGAGKIANDFIVALKTLPAEEHNVVAIAARSLDRCQAFCKQHNVEKAYDNYQALILDPDVQVVYVSTIHTAHKQLSLLALEHGKHVLCEKPLTLNLKDAKQVLEVAQQKNVFFMEAVWTRFFPLYAEVKRIIKSKEIGDLKLVMSSFGEPGGKNIKRLMDKDMGGGAMLDLGMYCLTVTDIVFGGEKPLVISASGHKTDSDVDETVAINMLYSGNRMAQMVTSFDAGLPNECIVVGTTGSIKICAPFWASTKIIKPDGTEKEFPLPKPGSLLNYPNSTGLRYEIQEVREKLLSGKPQSELMPHSTTERIMGWMDEIRRQIGVVYKED